MFYIILIGQLINNNIFQKAYFDNGGCDSLRKIISIIVPIYNAENSLEKTLNSIINQSYSKTEIILINDGSTDNSKEIIKKFAREDNRVKTIHKDNEGVSIARNIGIANANGDYIMFVDADDWLKNNAIEKLMQCALMHKSDITICSANVEIGTEIEKNSFFKVNKGRIGKERAIAQLFSNKYYNDNDSYIDVGVPWGKLYKTEFIKDNDLKFDSRLRMNEDNLFNLYSFFYANSIYYIDDPLYYYDYEHYSSTRRDYFDDMDVLNTTIANETIKFYEKFYSNNYLLGKLLNEKLSSLLISLITSKIYHPQYSISIQSKVKEIKKICENEPFSVLFENKKNYGFNLKSKIILGLLQKKQYRLTYFIYYIGYMINV